MISLEHDWLCEYFEHEPDIYELAASSTPVPTLTGWSCSEHYSTGWAAYMHRTFDLETTDFCTNYVLHIEGAPGDVLLFINGRRMGVFDGSQPFTFDVTDYVALEENGIALRVDCEAQGSFGRIYLEQVPCE